MLGSDTSSPVSDKHSRQKVERIIMALALDLHTSTVREIKTGLLLKREQTSKERKKRYWRCCCIVIRIKQYKRKRNRKNFPSKQAILYDSLYTG